MPVVRKRIQPESPQYRQLVNDLAAELHGLGPAGPNAPRIIEEEQRGGMLHVTVIWDSWESLPAEQRGKAIMDAYERERPEELADITVALGLTHAEAERLGIAWE